MMLGFVSDSHGCVEALDKALEVLRRAGAERVFHLGDSIGYFPGWAAADRLRELGVPSLRGNHEDMLLGSRVPPRVDDLCGISRTRDQAGPDQLAWAASLPETLRFDERGPAVLMMHGSPRDPVWEYIQPDDPLDGFDVGDAGAVATGHTHKACARERGGVVFMNPGSCVLPRDGSGLGSVCLWDTDARQAGLERFAVAGEARRAARRVPVHDTVMGRISGLHEEAGHGR